MKNIPFTIDQDYLLNQLQSLLTIPCPTGFTDQAVCYVCHELDQLKIDYSLTRRGTIIGNLVGKQQSPDRAVVTHLDTIGAMVREIKANGRLAITPVGHWSSRFAEGGRVSIFTDLGELRGTVLPIFAAGHVFNQEIDTQPVTWDHVEVRVDLEIHSQEDALNHGIGVGDFVAFDPNSEVLENGYLVSRHLDNKAGTASLLAAIKAVKDYNIPVTIDCHPIFTLSEETGMGLGHALDCHVTECVGIDIGPIAEGQNAIERGVTIAMKDSSGPYDYYLTHHLIDLCRTNSIPHSRDVFRYYYSDAVSAINAGHDVRHGLITFGTDATHGYERTHLEALIHCARLIVHYIQSPPAIKSDAKAKPTTEEFTDQAASYPTNSHTQNSSD
ncbi:osmoprotectant NAGGN system M42 family peptidase [Spartinivicinus poritis]|uniref:Osmoprotectant NAGGN system M42 family peptidase n=1 Tax=Spartinivicinus poritis TaxID=2994640 RepID=A0ABT5U778_9GAMM|nr:osmoprotectant NAGGN system M42 family peptidase [Spartinivicinus sp. A2-2]MDE1462215.1 osmoprotectant NAGGN system M42 family peptidase [Spartinivicinus sp. A2-2]